MSPTDGLFYLMTDHPTVLVFPKLNGSCWMDGITHFFGIKKKKILNHALSINYLHASRV